MNADWTRAETLAALLATDPTGLGGVTLRAGPGPARDAFLRRLAALMPGKTPWRRMAPGITAERLLGGLDLAATLAAGRPLREHGLLAASHGGVLIAPMAERLPAEIVGPLAAALDTGHVGFHDAHDATRFTLVLLDEGVADERAPAALIERLAFILDLEGIRHSDAPLYERGDIDAARARLGAIVADDRAVDALCEAGLALGVGSLRATSFALRVAKAAAALDDSDAIEDTHLALAAALIFAPRATTLPPPPESEPDEPEQPDPANTGLDAPEVERNRENTIDPSERPVAEAARDAMTAALSNQTVEAAKAAIPADLFAALQADAGARHRSSAGKSGAPRSSSLRGRPAGVRRGMPGHGIRLALVETLRAAAPWQTLRRRPDQTRVMIRREDFRVARYKERSETTTIFVVDASGSAALNRLAEVKGAVELILAECYVRRDSVALIAFRGLQADLLLPPTRSLARAKRALAGQAGGGGTPLASAIDAAVVLSEAIRRKGPTPLAVFLTDGRANVGRAGRQGRAEAEADALTAARGARNKALACLVIDISPRPSATARLLATTMGARYQPLPYVDARVLSQAILESSKD